jgi:chorismate mutase/prephenate dehydratase
LADTLEVFRDSGINLTRIESRPDRRKKWAYYFFVDLEGHTDTPNIATALDATAKRCLYWKVLGSYPRSDEVL